MKLYNILLDKNFTKEEAETMVSEIEAAVERKFENAKDTLGTKDDLRGVEMALKDDLRNVEIALKDDLKNVEMALKDDLKNVEMALKDDLNKVKMALKDDLHKSALSIKDDITRLVFWMVGLILGQTGLIFLILQLVGVFEK